jgi:DNA ligase-1
LEDLLHKVNAPTLAVSPAVEADSWDAIAAAYEAARGRGSEGLVLKRLAAAYEGGRVRGSWWKWKVPPHTVDAVLIAAEPGHGRRANLYSDYTFGVWADGVLVPIAKAYSGLSDEELKQVDAFVRRNITGRAGPVRFVEPTHVFELAFEGIRASNRHKAGIALRFPRMARWRTDKQPEDADKLATLQALLAAEERGV